MRKALLCMLTAVSLCISAYAAHPLGIFYQGCELGDNTIKVHFAASEAELVQEDLSLSIAGQLLTITELTTFGKTDDGATYLFIIDASGSISAAKLVEIKQMLGVIASDLSDKDNAAFMVLGNQLADAPFVSGAEDMQAEIDSIAATHQDTNLYAGIVKGMDILTTHSDVKSKRVMVILSDGEDYYPTGYTREEVDSKVNTSHIPLYTVAMLGKGTDQSILESAKILGSFARLSPGGLDITYGIDTTTSDEVAAAIVSGVNSSYVLTADISPLVLKSDQSLLELVLSIDSKGSATDSLTISSGLIAPHILPVQEEAATQPSYMVWIAVVAVVAIAGIITAIIVIHRKKKPEPLQEQEPLQMPIPEPPKDYTIPHVPLHESAVPSAPLFRVNFTMVGLSETERCTCDLVDEIIIGRNPQGSGISLSGDGLLSSRHCKISCMNGLLYLEDLSSKNGTLLNGVSVQSRRMLEQDDVIAIGSMKLRITWTASTPD